MKVAPILYAIATLAFAATVKSCEPLSQAERAELRASSQPRVPKPRRVAPLEYKPKCTENCPRTNDDQTVVISSIPGGVPMGGGVYMSVR